MFANSDRNTKRRIAGYLGGLLGASVAPACGLSRDRRCRTRRSTSSRSPRMCTLPGWRRDLPGRQHQRARHHLHVGHRQDVVRRQGRRDRRRQLPARASSSLEQHAPLRRRQAAGDEEAERRHVRVPCAAGEEWLDGSGSALTSPDVPKGWTLTLTSDLETVTCTWTKGRRSEVREQGRRRGQGHVRERGRDPRGAVRRQLHR